MKLYKLLPIIPILLLSSCSIDDYTYNDEGYIKFDSAILLLENINNLEVDWVKGSISITQGDEDSIRVKEGQTDYPLYYKVVDDTLNIKMVQNGMPGRIINKINKYLSITLPASFNNVTLNTVNTSVSMYDDITINKGVFNAVGGYFSAGVYTAKETIIDTVENNFYFSYAKQYPDGDNVLAHNMSIKTVSSNIQIGFNPQTGYDISWSGISCGLETYNGEKAYGEKLLKIDFDGVRSSLSLYASYTYEYGEAEY